jgi:UDP-glucuronate 4-epimerase
MEACRHAEGFKHLVYASSSSVYGDKPMGGEGFKEEEPATDPVSLYAATKRACELMSQSYAKLYGFPQTGLRFFLLWPENCCAYQDPRTHGKRLTQRPT